MKIMLISILSVMSFNLVYAGEIRVERRDAVYNNDVFDDKRVRAEEYNRAEVERAYNNSHWYYMLPIGCVEYAGMNLIYRCGDGLFYRGYNRDDGLEYQQLNQTQLNNLGISE